MRFEKYTIKVPSNFTGTKGIYFLPTFPVTLVVYH